MGYHVAILRTASGQGVPIGEAEVRQAVKSMAGRLEVMPGKPEFWLYQPAFGEESEIVAFSEGELWTSNPSMPLSELMIELAGYLGARVRGDELETYRTVDDHYIHPDDRELAAQYPPPRPSGSRAFAVAREMTLRTIIVVGLGVLLGSIVLLYRRLASGSA